jgi:hypothetical protein
MVIIEVQAMLTVSINLAAVAEMLSSIFVWQWPNWLDGPNNHTLQPILAAFQDVIFNCVSFKAQ